MTPIRGRFGETIEVMPYNLNGWRCIAVETGEGIDQITIPLELPEARRLRDELSRAIAEAEARIPRVVAIEGWRHV